MRVVEDSASSTSCAIMNEEKSLNGTESDGCNSKKIQSVEQNHSPNSDYSEQGYGSSGGRLKFFKGEKTKIVSLGRVKLRLISSTRSQMIISGVLQDGQVMNPTVLLRLRLRLRSFCGDGKFILELSHRRDGEKMSWIPVPKKTYWPPPVTTSTVTNSLRQESTASLSVSDDNSSVQLSPWQRDHCWKQTSPRKAASLDMTFLMMPLPRAFHVRRTNSLTIKRKRRRPFDPIEKVINWKALTNLNGYQRPVKLKNCAIKNGGLNSLVQRLWDYCLKSSESAQSVQKLSPSMFSPRKRILREFERVSLVGSGSSGSGGSSSSSSGTSNSEDQSQLNLKRSRAKAASGAVNGQSTVQGGGNSKGVSSYSITSLLGTKEEPQDQESSFLRTLLKSPKEEPSPEPSPKSRRNSPSQTVQSSPPPPPPPSATTGGSDPSLRGAPFPSVQFPYMHSPILYPHFLPQSPVAHHSPYFGMPASFRGSSPALWGVPYHHAHLSSPLHGGSYHGLMSPYSSQFNYWRGQPPSTEVKREDGSSDVPLNLSKNAS